MTTLTIATFCAGSHVTRADGAKVREAIEARWADSEPVVLDFEGVRVASVSFFDESMGLLARAHSLDELRSRVRVVNIEDSDRHLLNSIVSSRAKERPAGDQGVQAAVESALKAAGVSDDELARWDRRLLALYQDRSGHSHTYEEAAAQVREKTQRGDWTLDLGHFAKSLGRERGATLKESLDHLGVPYAKRSLGVEWAKSKRLPSQTG